MVGLKLAESCYQKIECAQTRDKKIQCAHSIQRNTLYARGRQPPARGVVNIFQKHVYGPSFFFLEITLILGEK